MATFTRNSTAFTQQGVLVNTNVPRYEFTRFPRHRWQDLFDTDQLATQYVSGGDTPATWTVSGGVLSGTGGAQATLLKTALTLSDCEIIVNTDQAQDAGVIARHVDNNNYYLLVLSDDLGNNPDANLVFIRRVAGTPVQLAIANITWLRGTVCNIRFALHGSRFEVFFNGVRVISIIDTTFASGSVGLRNSHATAFRVLDFAIHQAKQAVMGEEGTTNLLTANQASVETDLTGLNTVGTGVTIIRDTAERWHGVSSLRVTCDGASTFQGFFTTDLAATFASQNVSGSVWLRGTGNLALFLQEFTSAGVSVDSSAITLALTPVWTRYEVTRLFGATGVNARLVVGTHGTAQAVTFWADGLQIEQKPYATSWHLPGTSRVAEGLTLPPAGVFNRGSWTVEGVFTPVLPMNIGSVNKLLLDLHIDANNWYVFVVGAVGQWHFRIASAGVIRVIEGAIGGVSQNTSYHWQISGDGTTMRLCVNGVEIGATTYTEPVGTLPANMSVNNVSNGILSNLRFSNRARTLAEHQATFGTGQAFIIDNDTVFLLPLNNSLDSFSHIQTHIFAVGAETLSIVKESTTQMFGVGVVGIEVSILQKQEAHVFGVGVATIAIEEQINLETHVVGIGTINIEIQSYFKTPVSGIGTIFVSSVRPHFYVTHHSILEPLGVLILRGSHQDLIPATREATVSIPGKHGLYDFGSEFAQRTFEFKVAIEERLGEQTKQLLAKYLNPLAGKQPLVFANDINKTYMVKCAGQVVLDKFLNWLEFTIPFTVDPIVVGSFEKHQIGSGTLLNDGTFESPVRVRIVGAVTNPSITIGVSILRWTGVLTVTDVLEIDTEFMTVRLNGVNALSNYIGGFPKLLPGGTSVSATVAGTTTWMWRDRWI